MRLVKNDETVGQRTPAHVSEGGDFYASALDGFEITVPTHCVLKSVVYGTKIGINLLSKIAREETKFFTGFNGWTSQNYPFNVVVFQGIHCKGHCKIGLACAGRSYAKNNFVFADGVNVFLLSK